MQSEELGSCLKQPPPVNQKQINQAYSPSPLMLNSISPLKFKPINHQGDDNQGRQIQFVGELHQSVDSQRKIKIQQYVIQIKEIQNPNVNQARNSLKIYNANAGGLIQIEEENISPKKDSSPKKDQQNDISASVEINRILNENQQLYSKIQRDISVQQQIRQNDINVDIKLQSQMELGQNQQANEVDIQKIVYFFQITYCKYINFEQEQKDIKQQQNQSSIKKSNNKNGCCNIY